MGGPTPKVDVKSYYLANFSQKLHEIERIWTPRGMCLALPQIRQWDPFSLCYSEENKNNTFNNGDNKGRGLKNVTCKPDLKVLTMQTITMIMVSLMFFHHIERARFLLVFLNDTD